MDRRRKSGHSVRRSHWAKERAEKGEVREKTGRKVKSKDAAITEKIKKSKCGILSGATED